MTKGVFDAILVGDLHLDKLTNLFSNHLELQVAEIRKTLNYAILNGIKYAFFLGDISDKPRLSIKAKLALVNLINDYDGKIEMHFILGNHDVQMEDVHSLQFFIRLIELGKFKSVFIYDKPTQKLINGVPVNFLPFPATTSLSYGGPTLNLAHFEINGALRDNGFRIKKGATDIPDNQDIWIIGHLHTPQTIRNIYFPGTLYQLSFGESLPKGFAHITCKYNNNKLKFTYSWLENKPAFTLTMVNVTKESDFDFNDDNPYHLYKLHVHVGVKVPPNFNSKHPNVIDMLGYSNKAELQAISGLSLGDESGELEFGLTSQLKEYLASQGASIKQVKRARKKLNEIITKIEENKNR